MTHPPDDYALRDLEIESWLEALDHAHAEMAISPAARDASGAVAMGSLVTLVDLACARVTFAAAHPHWIATADLSLSTTRRPTDGVVRADCRVVRAGSKLIVAEVDLGDVGTALATFVRIPKEASLVERALSGIGDRTKMDLFTPPLTISLIERMGLRIIDGSAELDRTPYVGNSIGTINGGMLGYLVAAAAEEATGMGTADLTLRYLGQTKVGPARATATVIRRSAEHAVSDVAVRDAGADGALLARALVTTVLGPGAGNDARMGR